MHLGWKQSKSFKTSFEKGVVTRLGARCAQANLASATRFINLRRFSTMNKKIIALAIASAFAAPAAIAQSNVVIYGRANVSFENVKTSGAATASTDWGSRNRVSSNSSRLGFKGEEDLGNGLKAFFQVESTVAFDSGAASNGWVGRNTGVGLKGAFGSVLLGQWDTPYKLSTDPLDPFLNTGVAGYSSIIGNGGPTAANITGAASAAADAATSVQFDRRQRNSIQYWTPSYSGFSGRIMYSANEEKTQDTVTTTVQRDPSLWSVSGTYDNGPLYATLAYERHNDYGTGGTAANTTALASTEDTGIRAGIAYTFLGTTKVAFAYERLEFEPISTQTVKRNAYYVSLAHKMGPGTIRAAYTLARDPSGTTGAPGVGGIGGPDTNGGAKQYSLGYGYSLSKRTELYALYTKIKNDSTASYNFATNGLGAANVASGGVSPGSDPTAYGIGVIHNF